MHAQGPQGPTVTRHHPQARNGTMQRVVFEFLAITRDQRRVVVSAWFWIVGAERGETHLAHRLLSQRDGAVEVLDDGRYRLADSQCEIRPASPRFAWPALCRLAQDAMLGAAGEGPRCRFDRHCERAEACREHEPAGPGGD
jgi:hypothetical protein